MEPNAVPHCLRCRAPLLPNALFCGNCGFPVRLAPEPPPMEAAPVAEPIPSDLAAEPNGDLREEAGEPVHIEAGYRVGSLAYFPDTERKYDTGPLGGYVSAEAIDAPEFAPDAPPFVGPDAVPAAAPEDIQSGSSDPRPEAVQVPDPPVMTEGSEPEVYIPQPELFIPPLEEDVSQPDGLAPPPEEALPEPEPFILPPEPSAPPPETAAVVPSPAVSKRARLLSTSDFVLIELLSWIPVVNLIVLLVWMFRRDGNLTRARAAQAKLLTFFLLLLASVIILGILVLLISQGVLERLPIPAFYFR